MPIKINDLPTQYEILKGRIVSAKTKTITVDDIERLGATRGGAHYLMWKLIEDGIADTAGCILDVPIPSNSTTITFTADYSILEKAVVLSHALADIQTMIHQDFKGNDMLALLDIVVKLKKELRNSYVAKSGLGGPPDERIAGLF